MSDPTDAWATPDWLDEPIPVPRPTDWEPTPQPVPVELTEEFRSEPFALPAPTFFPALADRLPKATHDQLLAMAKGVL